MLFRAWNKVRISSVAAIRYQHACLDREKVIASKLHLIASNSTIKSS